MQTPLHSSITAKPIPGGWTERRISVGDRTFDLILPADPDQFLDHLDADASQEADPYWAALWPTAPIMAELLLGQDWSHWTAAATLELGCGCGLVGLAGLACGLRVTFADVVPHAVELALENAHRNGWTAARGQLLDWNQPPCSTYRLILGSDLLYETRHHEALLNAIGALLADGGRCWLGDPGRSAAESFVCSAADRGHGVRMLDSQGQPAHGLQLGHFRLLQLTVAADGENTGEGLANDIES